MELAGYSQTTPQPVPASDQGPAVFVVRVISAPSTQRDAFVACLSQNDLPFWRRLKEKGLLAKASVFETTSVTRFGAGSAGVELCHLKPACRGREGRFVRSGD